MIMQPEVGEEGPPPLPPDRLGVELKQRIRKIRMKLLMDNFELHNLLMGAKRESS